MVYVRPVYPAQNLDASRCLINITNKFTLKWLHAGPKYVSSHPEHSCFVLLVHLLECCKNYLFLRELIDYDCS